MTRIARNTAFLALGILLGAALVFLTACAPVQIQRTGYDETRQLCVVPTVKHDWTK